MKKSTYTLLIFGGFPLLIYPFVVLASVMGLAGHRTGNESIFVLIGTSIFYIGTIAYPVVYIICLRKAQKAPLRDEVEIAAIPLFYLTLLFIIMLMCGN